MVHGVGGFQNVGGTLTVCQSVRLLAQTAFKVLPPPPSMLNETSQQRSVTPVRG